MKTFTLTILLVSLFFSCNNENKKEGIIESAKIVSSKNTWQILTTSEWVKNKGLLNVESVIHDESNQVLYATNGKDYSLGTNGFISKISQDGILLDLKWIEGLNRPTGMAIHDSLLYVADVNALLVIDTRKGKVIKRYLEPIANSGLNDVSINDKGEVYVSASFIHSVCKIEDKKLVIWSKDEEKLKWANGLIAGNKKVVVAGLSLNEIDMESKEISEKQIDSPINDFDGIVSDGAGGYYVTTVGKSGLYHLNEQMNSTTLMESDVYFGDLEFDQKHKRIYIPRGSKKTNEFFITVLKMKKITIK